LSYLIAQHGDRIREIDINPLFVGPAGTGVVAADALVVLNAPSEGTPAGAMAAR
jgi:succinyl-CoA synthetase beta subunit